MALLDDFLGRRSGRVGPGAFFAIGLSLFALKFTLDRTVATLAFGRGWSVLNYLIPNETYALPSLPPAERTFYLTMIAVALPFVWIGIVVTLRRLRDAGLPGSLVALFFVPAVNLLFFATLSVIPTWRVRRGDGDDDDENAPPPPAPAPPPPPPPLDVLPVKRPMSALCRTGRTRGGPGTASSTRSCPGVIAAA